MLKEFHIKPYSKLDQIDFEEMVFALYDDDAYGEPMSSDKINKSLAQFDQNPQKGRIELLMNQQQVVGYAMLLYLWSNEHGGDFCIIDELYIKPDWRGQGLASSYFQMLEQSESKHCVGLQLEVTPENHRARKLYLSLGFELDSNDYLIKLLR